MNKVIRFLDNTFLDLGRQFKWTYLPPLMVYMAAGISGLTGIVGTFFVKDYLNLSAAFGFTGSSFFSSIFAWFSDWVYIFTLLAASFYQNSCALYYSC